MMKEETQVAGAKAKRGPKQTYSVADIAEKLDVDDSTVRGWINSGKLVAYKLPGSGHQCIIRVRRDVFEAFLRTYTAASLAQ